MAGTMTVESQRVAEELYRLIQTLDPARWRIELEESAHELITSVKDRLAKALDAGSSAADSHTRALKESLDVLATTLSDYSGPGSVEWPIFFRRLQPAYESIAHRLRSHQIDVPALRPTNHMRSIFHVGMGLLALTVLHSVPMPWVRGIATVFALWGWSMELGRRISPAVNEKIMKVFAPVAHPHEYHRINSASWYALALTIIAWLTPHLAASLGVIVLAFADPAAAAIGRRYGRIKLRGGRSLEGTITFAVVGLLAGLATITLLFPGTSFLAALILAAVGGVSGAIAELFSGQKVDDNLTIPVGVAFAVYAVMLFL
ncbi:MAG: dolichol kinase [Myxococcota bacterium]|jgi:dolichol kinase